MAALPRINGFEPIVCVVGFHHARGPEIEQWFGVDDGTDPAVDNDWSFLPFMALSDGAHASTEDFSYFTLRRRISSASASSGYTSAFGISCTRQLDAKDLIHKPSDVTRSTVQKAIVCIAKSPNWFGQLREKLSMVTEAWFAQRDFTDVDILKVGKSRLADDVGSKAETQKKKFQESLSQSLKDADDDQYLGLSLRELIHEYTYQTLVLFKCCLLQPKMLFFGSRCERLCMVQFALISLIPGLLRHLEDCADPEFDKYEKNLVPPTSLKTSDRSSLLAYMGLPLQLFGKGGMYGPYTPLQQLDLLADKGTTSYIVGSTNSLLLQQKDRYSDILINLDETSVNITSTSLRTALILSAADRRWIDFLTQTVYDTWDEDNPSRPKTMGYMGSEEFIRLQFEEYLLALLSTVKYHNYLALPTTKSTASTDTDPLTDFNPDWVHHWQTTTSYALFARTTDTNLFDIVEPRHPTAGNLSIEDIQRRLNLQIQALNLDERFATSKEALNKHLASGQKKVSTAFANLWDEFENIREAQRKRAEDAKHGLYPPPKQTNRTPSPAPSDPNNSSSSSANRFAARAPDLTAAQASLQEAGKKAGAYMSTWGSWASERRKAWSAGKPVPSPNASQDNLPNSARAVEPLSSPSSPPRAAASEERKLARLSSRASIKSVGKGGKEEKGADGIGRLDA